MSGGVSTPVQQDVLRPRSILNLLLRRVSTGEGCLYVLSSPEATTKAANSSAALFKPGLSSPPSASTHFCAINDAAESKCVAPLNRCLSDRVAWQSSSSGEEAHLHNNSSPPSNLSSDDTNLSAAHCENRATRCTFFGVAFWEAAFQDAALPFYQVASSNGVPGPAPATS